MYYVGTLFVSKFPYAFEEQRIVNGVEQTCLVLPCEAGQMERTRYGAWFVRLRCELSPPNPQQKIVDIRLGYKNLDEFEKARRSGIYERTKNLGHLFVAEEDDDTKKLDKTNNMIPIQCDGRLFIDSIAKEDIKTDPRTGRKYVDIIFRKSRLLDAFGNSHEIIVPTDYGEHQIGVARQLDIEPAPQSAEAMLARDERTVEQRCAYAGEKIEPPTKIDAEPNEPKRPTVYDSFEW